MTDLSSLNNSMTDQLQIGDDVFGCERHQEMGLMFSVDLKGTSLPNSNPSRFLVLPLDRSERESFAVQGVLFQSFYSNPGFPQGVREG